MCLMVIQERSGNCASRYVHGPSLILGEHPAAHHHIKVSLKRDVATTTTTYNVESSPLDVESSCQDLAKTTWRRRDDGDGDDVTTWRRRDDDDNVTTT